MWDLIVSVPDHCLSFYLALTIYMIKVCRSVYQVSADMI